MTVSRAFLGLSHTPLLGVNPVASEVTAEMDGALARLASSVQAWSPDLVVLIAPDHYNGFFNELMPPFCIGTQATSVGDYRMPAGPLRVDEGQALALAGHLMCNDFDVAVSRRMQVDHGFVQPLQLLWGSLGTPPVIPIFLNAVADPGVPSARRCVQLGAAIGQFLDGVAQKVLLIGSGGLSHEPPVPTLDHPDAAVRERITVRQTLTPASREARMRGAMAAGHALAQQDPSIKPLNPLWDAWWMDHIERSDFAPLAALKDSEITAAAGRSAHESKTWLVARAAASAEALRLEQRYYRSIPEYIAGFGILWMPG
jgi:2,3-dihydroxyphenylpropionate 1,2-dioxygenase